MEVKDWGFKMKKTGTSVIFATVLIILVTIAAVSLIWGVIIPMIVNNLEVPISLEFPNSTSDLLTEIGKTYLAGENAVLKIIAVYPLVDIQMDNSSINFEKIGNNTFAVYLDTLISNGASSQTKVISFSLIGDGGKIIGPLPVNYQVVSNSEQFVLQKAQNAEILSKRSNIIALGAIVISIILFIIDLCLHNRIRKLEIRIGIKNKRK